MVDLSRPNPPDLSIYECKKCDMVFSEYCVVIEEANKYGIDVARCPICDSYVKEKIDIESLYLKHAKMDWKEYKFIGRFSDHLLVYQPGLDGGGNSINGISTAVFSIDKKSYKMLKETQATVGGWILFSDYDKAGRVLDHHIIIDEDELQIYIDENGDHLKYAQIQIKHSDRGIDFYSKPSENKH